ncbi:DUF3299 domain-containing protein [Shewanella sp. WXL01]|uniref:DUF3299 domain-containing protein n=1 Tax=Shewanella maritima TaxID=2520507 RepID=A0A411PDV0_9GAMM|nr:MULTISPECIES: DUF3299 domain-containing protein [Shewanella]NKF50269.1 DUF3299 domain-containing protein [Shewanella sp. WXL01]QBF81701.1 DUF3299 domain-containing protein [Shewanella maritima]
MKNIIIALVVLAAAAAGGYFYYDKPAEKPVVVDKNYQELVWDALMPADELEIILNPPEEIYNIEDGASNDNIDSLQELAKNGGEIGRYYQALTSARVVDSFNNADIKIPGFIVPLVYNEQDKLTEFFIVPYYGACLHMPPPPPNQMLYSKVEEGIDIMASTYSPYWFEGTMAIAMTERDIGSAAYQLDVDTIVPYVEPEVQQ